MYLRKAKTNSFQIIFGGGGKGIQKNGDGGGVEGKNLRRRLCAICSIFRHLLSNKSNVTNVTTHLLMHVF